MTIERTFSIIKPDATGRNLTGAINTLIEAAGLRIVAQKRVQWTRTQAQKFYAEHKGRPFFDELCERFVLGDRRVLVLLPLGLVHRVELEDRRLGRGVRGVCRLRQRVISATRSLMPDDASCSLANVRCAECG